MGDQLRHVTDALRVAGVTVADIADREGSSPQHVSAELAGRRPMSFHTVEAIRRLAGADLAAEIQTMTGRARAEYLEKLTRGGCDRAGLWSGFVVCWRHGEQHGATTT